MEKTNIQVDPTKCTGCLSCQLRCSLAYTGAFNPEKARVVIDHILDQPTAIYFTNECIKDCILCTRYCIFGAMEAVKS